MTVLIIDGYVDEPAQFGVPPYVSAYARYTFGISLMCGYNVIYKTIDEIRGSEMPPHDILITVGGVTVPGNYLGGTPMSVEEAMEISNRSKSKTKVIVGSMAEYSIDRSGGISAKANTFSNYQFKLWRDYERDLYEILSGEKWANSRYDLVRQASVFGARMLAEHPNFPDLMCEIELGMGCERHTHCSFCTEPLWGAFVSRPVEDVIKEVKALYEAGARHFRLGRISNIFAYMGKDKPNPKALLQLYKGIRKVAPNLKTLHTDNANPGYMYSHLKDMKEMISIITKYNTPGDSLSMGVESFDPNVILKNNLKIDFDHFLRVVELVNSTGAERVEGVPRLLPGVNLLYGLPAEKKMTYKMNYDAMMNILNAGLMVRRVNVRKAMAFPQTPLFDMLKGRSPHVNDRLYKHFKYVLRRDFDHPMLERVFPRGTVLRDVIVEKHSGNVSYGRQIGTYAILVGIPKLIPVRTHVNCIVVDHGQRSLTALPIPLNLNTEPLSLIKWIPGIGKHTLQKIEAERPYKNVGDFAERTKADLPLWIREMILFN